MPKLVTLVALALVAGTSIAAASAPASGSIPADLMTPVLPSAHVDTRADILSRNGWQSSPSVTTETEDVEITGGPAARPSMLRPAEPVSPR